MSSLNVPVGAGGREARDQDGAGQAGGLRSRRGVGERCRRRSPGGKHLKEREIRTRDRHLFFSTLGFFTNY